MTGPKRTLATLVAAIAAVMLAVAVYALVTSPSRAVLGAISGSEIVASAVLVLPWFAWYSRQAAVRFSGEEAASIAWNALSVGSLLLIAGQIAAFAPKAADLGPIESWLVVAGQAMPATFRIVLCWALWRMQRAYRATGLDFHLRPIDYILSISVAVVALVLVGRVDTLFAYWTANVDFSPAMQVIARSVQIFNYLLYAAVFFISLSMTRFAMQMGGGLVARAWGGVALYGILQPIHVFIIAIFWPIYGPIVAVGFDNFIVLAAFSALAFGPLYQLEAADVSRPPTDRARD